MIEINENWILYSTKGSSMFPFIRWDEYILVKKVPTESMRLGDVIVCQSEQGGRICHRLVKREEKEGGAWLWTKGDRNPFSDPPVGKDAVLGRVVAVKRKMRWVAVHRPGWKHTFNRVIGFVFWSMFCTLRGIKSILKNLSPKRAPRN